MTDRSSRNNRVSTQEETRPLADVIDSLDNMAHALLLPMPAQFHVERFQEGLPALILELKAAYSKEMGENPWQE